EVHLGHPVESLAEVRAQVIDAADRAVGAPFTVSVPAGQTKAQLSAQLDNIRTWTAETPHLYRVRFTLTAALSKPVNSGDDAGATTEGRARPGEMRPLHTVTERFGFRTLEVRPGDGVYLNGTKIVLKGINRHCFW